MRRKLIALVCAAVLAMALPALAFAADSDIEWRTSSPYATTGSNVAVDGWVGNADQTIVVDGTAATIELNKDLNYKFEISDRDAANYETPDGFIYKKQSYTIESDNFKEGKDVITVVWYAGAEYEGLTCEVFVEHADGDCEQKPAEVNKDGEVTIYLHKLSTVTFALTNKAFTGDEPEPHFYGTQGKDTKATSPKTGGIEL